MVPLPAAAPPAPEILVMARVLARCLVQTAAAASLIALAAALLPARGRRAAALFAVSAAVPGMLAALWPAAVLAPLPGAWAPGPAAPHWRLVPAALPLLLLFPLWRSAHLLPGQRRAALGLGAGVGARIRLVWLPQLGAPALLGLAAAAGLDLSALLLRG